MKPNFPIELIKRKNYLILAIFLFQIQLLAQVPQGIPYQAAARNSNGQPLANRAVQVRFSILDSTTSGIEVYKELHNTTTNSLGLFTLNIGMGIVITGTFSSMNWGQNFKFLKVELDTTASGGSYVDLGTQQMMSVPYALYSGSSSSLGSNQQRIVSGTIDINGANIAQIAQGSGFSATKMGIYTHIVFDQPFNSTPSAITSFFHSYVDCTIYVKAIDRFSVDIESVCGGYNGSAYYPINDFSFIVIGN